MHLITHRFPAQRTGSLVSGACTERPLLQPLRFAPSDTTLKKFATLRYSLPTPLTRGSTLRAWPAGSSYLPAGPGYLFSLGRVG